MAEATQELKDKISQDGSEDSNGSRLPGKGAYHSAMGLFASGS